MHEKLARALVCSFTLKVFDLDEPLTSPDQPPNALLLGVAVIVALLPHAPVPPPEAVPPVPAVTVSVHEKLARALVCSFTLNVFDLDEPLTSPDQPPKALLLGVAVMVALLPHAPVPPPEAIPPVPAVTVSMHEKAARALVCSFTLKVFDFDEPLTSPDQPPNALLLGVAVIVALLPHAPVPPPEAVPPVPAVTVSVHEKLARALVF